MFLGYNAVEFPLKFTFDYYNSYHQSLSFSLFGERRAVKSNKNIAVNPI